MTKVIYYKIKVEGTDQQKDEIGRVKAQIIETTAEMNNLNKASSDYTKRLGELSTELGQLKGKLSELNKENRLQNSISKEQEGSITQLRAKLGEMITTYDRYSASVRNSNVGQAMLRDIQALQANLNKLEQATGRYQRQVGNYNTAGLAMSQVLREIPAFTFSAQTGILALSNNLPILADEFRKLSSSIDANTQKQVGFVGALKQMGANIFSFGSVMTIALGVFTIFSDKIFSFIGGSKKATEAIKEQKTAQEELNEAMQNYNTLLDSANYQNLQEVLQVLRSGADTALLSLNELRNALSNAQKQLENLKIGKSLIGGIWVSTDEDKRLFEASRTEIQGNIALIQGEVDKREAATKSKRKTEAEKEAEEIKSLQREINESKIALINDSTEQALAAERERWRQEKEDIAAENATKDEIRRLTELKQREHYNKLTKIYADHLAELAKERDKKYNEQQERESKHRTAQLKGVQDVLKSGEDASKTSSDNIEKTTKKTWDDVVKTTEISLSYIQKIESQYFKMKEEAVDRSLRRQQRAIQDDATMQNEILKNRLDKGLDTEAQYQKKKEDLDKATREKDLVEQKKAFDKKKKLAKQQAVIDYNVAVAEVWANSGGNYIAGIIKSALYTAQFALIYKSIEEQEFATGGRVKNKDKNIPTKPNGDSVFATLTPGEVVLNKSQQAMLGGDSTFARIGVPGFEGAYPSPDIFGGTKSMMSKKEMSMLIRGIAGAVNNQKVYNIESESKRIRNQVDNYESEARW